MNILFVRPRPPKETIGLQHVMIVEPLELEVIATLVQEHNNVEILDLILENKSIDFFLKKLNPDIVCVTGYLPHTNVIKDICIASKKFSKEVITIVGGIHIEKLPETVDHEAIDFRVVRNATRSFPSLINYLNNKGAFPNGVLRVNEQMNEDTLPDYDFYFPISNRELTAKYRKKYFYVFHNKVALLKTSFGCPYKCNFCYCRKITGENYVTRDLSEVIEELKGIKEKEIYIVDDDFLVSVKRLTKFMDLLEKNDINKKYLIFGRADFIIKNYELLKRFKKLGLRTILVGFESFNNDDLKVLNKNTSMKINEETMNVLNSLGINCYASIIAMPEWTENDFKEITQKLISLKVRFLNIQPLAPLEKTDIVFDDQQLIVPRTDYAKWDLAHVVVKPKYLEVSNYYENILKMYETILFRPTNLIHHLKYPIPIQIKLVKGTIKVRKQYKDKIAANS